MKKPIDKIIKGLSTGFAAEERETSILFDHHDDVVHLETTEPFTARRWHELLKNDQQVKFDETADSLKIQVPIEYCRKPELILMAKYRSNGGGKPDTTPTQTANERSIPETI